MEENKEMMEQAALVSEGKTEQAALPPEEKTEQTALNTEEKTEQTGIAESEKLPVEPNNKSEKNKKENVASWFEKSVTRKFVLIALAAAVLLNAAVTSGITGAQLKKQSADIAGMYGNGHSRGEMQFDKRQHGQKGQGGKDKMMPPGSEQNAAQDQAQASNASIGIVIKEDSGVIVSQVTGDKAKSAGFKEGDKIVSVEGKNISTSNDLISEVQSHKAGDTITVTVDRDGQSVEIKTELE